MAENGFNSLLDSMEVIDREAFTSVVGKYPELKNGFLRQSDYSKNMDLLRDKSNEFDTQLAALQQWSDENIAEHHENGTIVTKNEALYKNRTAELEQELLRVKETEMTFDDLSKNLDTLGYAKKSDFETVLSGKEQEVNRNFEGYMTANLKLQKAGFNHLKEFGEPLDPEEFFTKQVVEKKNYDIDRAYSDYVADRRTQRQQVEFDQKIEAARVEERTKAKQEFAMSNTGHMPTDSSGPVVGALQAKLTGLNQGETPAYKSPLEYAREWRSNN